MSTDVNVRRQQAPVERGPASRFRLALPPEIAATVLAVSTVALGAVTWLPTYGIFLGWAAAGLAGAGRGARLATLGCCLAIGAVFGAGTLAATAALESALGPDVPQWLCAMGVLAIANPLMILLGRAPALSSVPGMFIGFSTMFAVHLGNTAPISGDVVAAMLVTVAMNTTGLGFLFALQPHDRSQPQDRSPARRTPARSVPDERVNATSLSSVFRVTTAHNLRGLGAML